MVFTMDFKKPGATGVNHELFEQVRKGIPPLISLCKHGDIGFDQKMFEQAKSGPLPRMSFSQQDINFDHELFKQVQSDTWTIYNPKYK
jgi:hypothetical protein